MTSVFLDRLQWFPDWWFSLVSLFKAQLTSWCPDLNIIYLNEMVGVSLIKRSFETNTGVEIEKPYKNYDT